MNMTYRALAQRPLRPNTLIAQNQENLKQNVSLDDAATLVMTDFSRLRPFSIPLTVSISDVNRKMISCGVRLLFVGSDNDQLLGVVTYNDIFGDKPVKYVQEHGGSYEDVLAQDIMTPLNSLEALERHDVESSCVGDIVETIKSGGRQHILVVENQEDESVIVSGLFSSTQIEKQLNSKIELTARAKTFADLERALAN